MSNNGQNNGLTTIFAFFAGFMAGAVVSLLYAPTSGKETRQKIRDTSIEAKNRTVELAHQASDSARQGVHNIVGSGKERFQQAGDQVKHAVETGRKVSEDVRTKIVGSVPGIGNTDETEQETSEDA